MNKSSLIALITAVGFVGSAYAQDLTGTFPDDGGPISVMASGGDVNASGLDFISNSGGLIPIPPGDLTAPAAPFTFLLANSPSHVTYGNLGTSVSFADGSTTTLSVGAVAGTSDLQAAWGNGPEPITFSVTGGGAPVVVPPVVDPPVVEPPVVEPPVVEPPVVEPPVVEPPIVVPPSGSGGVSGLVRDGRVVIVATSPVEAAGLLLNSPAGRLIPVPDPPDATPFQFLLSNTANEIVWGNLGTNVTIAGELVTAAGYTGAPTGDLSGAWGDGAIPRPISFAVPPVVEPPIVEPPIVEPPVVEPPVVEPPVVEPPVVEPPVVEPPVVEPPVVDPPEGTALVGEVRDGQIVLIANEPIEAAGIDLNSPAGNLVPAEGPEPFAFLLSNTANQVTFGNLGSTVSIEGEFAIGVGYNGDPAGDLTAAWGDGPTPVVFPITTPGPIDPGNETIPEPASGLLSVFAALGILAFRGRRS